MPSRAPAVGLTPFAIEGFRGLDLASDPEEVGAGGAIDLRDVDLDRRGRVRQRDGLTTVKTLPDINGQPVARMLPYWSTSSLVVTTTGSKKIYVLSSSWTVAATQALSSANAGDVVSFGVPNQELVYISDLGVGLRKLSATTFSIVPTTSPNNAPRPLWLAVQKPDNRLVAGYTDSTVDAKSKVAFSNALNPDVWNTNDYVLLSPSDGGWITGLVSWRDLLFAFKQDKFFVFYGNSEDSSGNPIFNYRAVDIGLGIAAGQSAVAGREGVYFVNQSGIWLTTGGPPTKISQALEPLFQGWAPAWFSPGAFVNVGPTAGAMHRLGYALGRLFATLYCSDGQWRTFVYDPETHQWVMWTGDIGYTIEYTPVGQGAPEKVYMASSGYTPLSTPRIMFLDSTVSTDDGTFMSSYYRSGFFDLDQPGIEKTVRQTEVVGKGTVSFAWSRNLAAALNVPSSANVTMGTFTVTGRGLHRNADYGELLSFQLTGVSGAPWTVDRVVPMVQSVRGAGAFS